LTFNLVSSDISRILLYTHIYAEVSAKHQQHVCVQTETKPARSNQTFAAVSLSHDNDSVNSYDAGSRYLSFSFTSSFNFLHIRKEAHIFCAALFRNLL